MNIENMRVKKLIDQLRPVVQERHAIDIKTQFDLVCFTLLESTEWLLNEVEAALGL